ncbi:hypothetical protein C8R47DRAFT_1258379 [Mycena vitilis]|nr:hypothetical protein C8R47DRAFT_1258379 [Mycena vitilis]
MQSQGMNTRSFCAPPLDGSLTIPQLLDYHLERSPNHKAYIYDDGQGAISSVEFAEYIRAVHAACRLLLRDTEPGAPHKVGAVVALFADTGSLYCQEVSVCGRDAKDLSGMLVTAIMRAGHVPFCLSPHNAAEGVANLLRQTNPIAVYISPGLDNVIVDAFTLLGSPLPVHVAPTFEQLRGTPTDPLPALSTAAMDGIAYILHTSGSTSIFSKPVYMSHKFLIQFACPPWKDFEDHSGQVLGVHNLPNYHGVGVFLATWGLTSGLTLSVFPPSTPQVRGTPENALNGNIATNPDFVMATPATVEAWSESPRGLAMMKSLKALTFLGAPLNKRVGDDLVANGVVLCSTYGAMETGLVATFLESHGVDWDYMAMRPGLEIARVPEEDDPSLHTHTYLVNSTYTTSYTNSIIEGRPGCLLRDLLEQHPHKPELHRVYGRKDDIIIFSTGFKMSPGSIESHINMNPVVDAALIFGHTMPHPGVLVQLKADFQNHLVDDAKRVKILRLHLSLTQFPQQMIVLADPKKPFALTSKLQPRRRVVFEHYQEEICAAYL